MAQSEKLDTEQLLASAVAYLIEGGDTKEAELLLFCTVEDVQAIHISDFGDGRVEFSVNLNLRGPRAACEFVEDRHSHEGRAIADALSASLPFDTHLNYISTRASVHVADENWRADLLELAKGKGISNQGSGADNSRLWQGFRFRSATEIKIAEALDRAGVLFFPLPKARLAPAEGRRMNIEPDFVVCAEGRWGILEIDGEPYHPPQRSALEHDRDRLFKRHGVNSVERFDAKRCFNEPDKVVEEFRLLLVKAYRRP